MSEDNPLSQWFSEEELGNLFSNISDNEAGTGAPGAEEKRENPWTISRYDTEWGRRASLHNGFVRLDVDDLRQHEYLSWDAVIPDLLLPGQSAKQFSQDFEPFVFYRLATKIGLYGRDNMNTVIANGRYNTIATLFSRGQPQSIYSLWKNDEHFQFAVDFCGSRGNDIYGLEIATNNVGVSPYTLRINYASTPYDHGSLGIVLPKKDYYKSSWNPRLMDWVLSTHIYAREFAGDNTAASAASEAVMGLRSSGSS